MDTSGYLPQLGNDDPLFEIADYTQLMKTKLEAGQSIDVIRTDTNWSYAGGLWIDRPLNGIMRVNLTLRLARLGGSFGITTSAIQAMTLIPAGYRPIGYAVSRYGVMMNSAGDDVWGIYTKVNKDGNLFISTNSGSATVSTGNIIELDASWVATAI